MNLSVSIKLYTYEFINNENIDACHEAANFCCSSHLHRTNYGDPIEWYTNNVAMWIDYHLIVIVSEIIGNDRIHVFQLNISLFILENLV